HEFPSWSFLSADLPAHLLDLPVVLLAVAACASLVSVSGMQRVDWRARAPTLAVISLALGAAWCINTWDVPTYGVLSAVTLVLCTLPLGRASSWRKLLARLSDLRALRGRLAAVA